MDKAQDNKQPPTAPPAVDRFNVPDIPPQDQGLKVLHDPKDVDAIDVDIVAVHGIMANPTSTWKHSKTGTNWLADPLMLPESLKEHGVRIMAFGYESKWFGRGSVRQSLSNLATDLLQALNQKREHCPQRPIIFIAHCFGGLVAQKAYTMAALQEGDYPGIWKSTKGMMFLGTPHSGVNDGTNLTKQGQIYDAIVARKLEVQDNVLLTVARDNDVLVDAVSEFARKVSTSAPPPMLFSFYELKPTNLGAIVGQKFVPEFVVGQSSATLLGHEKQGLALDHFGINKFEDNQDNNYQKVSWRILKMVREAKVDSLNSRY
ncbi:LOW QUALITY PROTEIN: And nb-arc domain-containing protein [Colletotrichum higginsianum IMI 349063]|uniref:And nb-arc domain-containing protein n=1 Tax=Colletotrichum higginsianum (strain IMI 349063) TaxID=759273 RepID=A0A1B7XYA4_COLHI|nr:LOW QUALITY PROTEIN: And nb-arc domain-containing protein [Colletotrichum higginsianum IMI 349063]OBR04763.1 LOW QUALITY PROTEIN: And nb-arc domain-containing protein [Colletotrichum higginsianum IMI 349063]